jgi:hypothetical protein
MPQKQKASWSNINGKLKGLSERDLKFIIKELYSLNSEVKNYLNAKFLNEEELLLDLKGKIEKYLTPHPTEWKGPELAKAKRVIQSFRKATSNSLCTLKLMVHYYDLLTKYQYEYGPSVYVDSPGNSMFKEILILMNTQDQESIRKLLSHVIRIRKRWEYAEDYKLLLKEYAPRHTGLLE